MLVCCVRMKSVCSMYVPPTTTSITINRTSNASGVLHIELIIPTHLHPAQPVPRGCLLLERPEAKKPPRSQTTRQYVHNRKCSLVIWPCKDRRSGHLGASSSRRTINLRSDTQQYKYSSRHGFIQERFSWVRRRVEIGRMEMKPDASSKGQHMKAQENITSPSVAIQNIPHRSAVAQTTS